MRVLLKLLRWIGMAVLGVIALAALAVGAVLAKGPSLRDAPKLTVAAGPSQLERGRYLFHHVADCAGCHSEDGGPVGAGMCFGPNKSMCVPNITNGPDGVGGWTDGEVLRALREGVHKDGSALVPMMPSTAYRVMSDQDAEAVVAYLRTLSSHGPARPRMDPGLLTRMVASMQATPIDTIVPGPADEPLARGRYLAELARCAACHGPGYAGGMAFKPGVGNQPAPSINGDPEGAARRMTKEQFISRFRTAVSDPALHASKFMPWTAFAGLSDEDLGDLHAFLLTQKSGAAPGASR